MRTSLNRKSEHEVELDLEVAWSVVADDYDDLLKQYAKLPIKGFRHPSVGVVENTYKRQLRNDLAGLCSERLFREAAEQEGVVAGSPVTVSEIVLDRGGRFGFRASFLLMPTFEVPDYKNLALVATDAAERTTEISEKLLNLTPIDLPAAFVDRELLFSDTESDIPTDEERAAAVDRVRLLLILKRIAAKDAVEVDDRDIENRIREIAAENNVQPQALREFLLSNGGFSRLRDYLLAERVLDYISGLQP